MKAVMENEAIRERINVLTADASNRYHAKYDNIAYRKATSGKSVKYANALIDEAMAVCGHPSFRVTWRSWGVEAEAFLERFV